MQEKYKIFAAIFLLVIITSFSFYPSIKNGFVNIDDNALVIDNHDIRSLSFNNLKKHFTEPYFGLYHPLVQVSLSIDYKLFGLNPAGYHATNIFLHIINTILVFWLFFLISGNVVIPLITAFLFAVHPMHVESVAWISERKDVLFSAFYLGSMVGYIYYIRKKGIQRYLAVLLLFLCALFSKIMAVSLPFVLLFLDYLLERKNIKKVMYEKIPFFALGAVFGVIALLTHYQGADHIKIFYSFFGNIVYSMFGLLFYLYKMFFPGKLSFGYPYNWENFSSFSVNSAFIVAIFWIAVLFVYKAVQYTRKIVFGALFYLITILPVIQLIPSGQNCPFDRYTYMPFIGIFYILAAGYYYLFQNADKILKKVMSVVLALIISVLSMMTFQRSKIWNNSFTLWNSTLKSYTTAAAYKGLGDTYKEKGDFGEALNNYAKAEKLKPSYADVYNNRGTLYMMIGEYKLAYEDFSNAIHYNPANAGYSFNRGILFEKNKNYYKALIDYSNAIKNNPKYAQAYNNRGIVFAKLGKYGLAVKDFRTALYIDPGLKQAEKNLSYAEAFLKKQTR